MALNLNLPVAVGIVLAIVAAGTGGLVVAPFMTLETTLMMVLPSMLAFAAVVFLIGVKHGEYRANAR
jgi:ABC-type dipeptide/oligopeptide/nickel transport system permease subunit